MTARRTQDLFKHRSTARQRLQNRRELSAEVLGFPKMAVMAYAPLLILPACTTLDLKWPLPLR